MTSRSFAWLSLGGGAWSLASNWNDLTDGVDPSLIVPGAQDSVTVAGPAGNAQEVITGAGLAALAVFTGNTQLAGSFGFGTLTVGAGGTGGVLEVAPGAAVQAGSAAIAAGSVVASGAAASLIVSGTLTLGTGQQGQGGVSCTLDATSGAQIELLGLTLAGSAAHIYVDPSSIVEIGHAGGALAGRLTVDSGARLAGFGDANAYGSAINNGTIAASGGLLEVGTIAGIGTLEIDAGATVQLNGSCAAGQTINFAGSLGTLALSAEHDAPAGIVRGFAQGDAIDVLGSPLSTAIWAPTGQGLGQLTLTYGGQIAATMTLAGDYTQDVFLLSGDGAGGTLVTVAQGSGGGGTASPGTPTPDLYAWIAAGSGNWNSKANWRDITANKNPAAIAPGVHDLVTIAAPQASFDVIAGPANAASLAITGEVALSGVFAIGALAVGDGPNAVAGTLDLLPGTTIAAASAAIADGAITLAGSGTALSVAGTLALGGGAVGVGLPVTSLSAGAGAALQAGGLTLGGGSGDAIVTDPTASIEIGTAGRAAKGAFTVDPGVSISGNGSINPYGNVIDGGTITATGGTLTLGLVTGAGVLAAAGGATLDLVSSTALPIVFTGPAATLAISSELVTPTGTLSGWIPGCVLDVQNDPIDNATFTPDNSGNSGTLYLSYGGHSAGHLALAGSFAGEHFLTAPDGAGGTAILLDKSGGGGGGGGGGNTDVLAWAQPVSGAWNQARNWSDLTTGTPSKVAPGAQNAVQIAGPGGGGFQTIGGPGASASLTFTGDSLLAYAFSTGSLSIGTDVGGTVTNGFVELNYGAQLTASQAALAGGNLVVSQLTALAAVTGTLTVGSGTAGGADISSQAQGSITLGALVLAGGSAEADVNSWLEIGTTGGATKGALTVDSGAVASGFGSLDVGGAIIDGGAILASGGTLTVGATSGAGMLSIGNEATLALAGAETCPIVFSGGGGSLVLPGSYETPAGVIAGFAAGDSILLSATIIGEAVWQPGAGGVGTLTLSLGGQVAGTLLLAGDYSNDTFVVTPTDAGARITVQAGGNSGPPPGTPGPDVYVWTGAIDTAWNKAANWNDVTAGLNPAAVAPGQHNLVTIQGPAQGYQYIVGPADAAELALLGDVALQGQFAIGTLAVGNASTIGVLALETGTAVAASNGLVDGALAVAGTLSVGGGLMLGQQASSGLLNASSGGVVTLGGLDLAAPGSSVTADGASSIEIGGNADGSFTMGTIGTVTIDPGGLLSGQGAVDLVGITIDLGSIVAEGGTLAVGAVSGTGTLEIGPGATLALDGQVGGGLTIDFTAAGTLTLAEGMLAAGIAGFGGGDAIVTPDQGATSALYAQTAPGVGLLTLYAGSQVLDQLTLLGADAGASFAVAAAPGGGTVITTTAGNGSGNGGSGMPYNTPSGPVDITQFIASLPDYAQYWLGQALGEGTNNPLTPYVWNSVDGSDFGQAVPIYANVGIVAAAPTGTLVTIPLDYVALVAEGNGSIGLADPNARGLNDPGATLVGNMGRDTIVGANNDTLVGALGANTVFAVDTTVTIQGGGNDIYNTGQGNVTIITSSGQSIIALGDAQNLVTSFGNDTIACLGGGTTSDTIDASTSLNQAVVFGPSTGSLNVYGGNAPDIVVAGGGQVFMTGGAGGDSYNPNELWGGSGLSSYTGGAGAGAVIGGSGQLQVYGGAGPTTVYGGTGETHIFGSAGNSVYLVGLGASTVAAAEGNSVYVVGAADVQVTAQGSGIFVWGAGSSANNTYTSGAGYETLVGGAGNDIFNIGNGQGLYEGLGGADLFRFAEGVSGGSATIYDFNTTQDQIGLAGYAGGAQAVLASETISGGNTQFTLQDGTHVTLLGVTNLALSNFVVT